MHLHTHARAQGKMARRIQAPGAPMQHVVQSDIAARQAALNAQLVAAWQRGLAYVAPDMAHDR